MTNDFCEYCNTSLDVAEKLVNVYRHRKSQHFIFEQVPAQVCPRCGERYYSAEVVREMDRLMKTPSASTQSVNVPLISWPLAS
ncbi:MAG: type II toxin-antitoxin system MqsA family antitoxin [Acidobacteria bacterium]|nr:type II toxin-antitoxin system MqsA family antitoxin [Acidobacteriota bacterium]